MATVVLAPGSIWDKYQEKIEEDEDIFMDVLQEFVGNYEDLTQFVNRKSVAIPSVEEFNCYLKDLIHIFGYLSEQFSEMEDDEDNDDDALTLIGDVKTLQEYAMKIKEHFSVVESQEEIKNKLESFYEKFPSSIAEGNQASARFITVMGKKMKDLEGLNSSLEEGTKSMERSLKFLTIDVDYHNLIKKISESWFVQNNLNQVRTLLSGNHSVFTPEEMEKVQNFSKEVQKLIDFNTTIRQVWVSEILPNLSADHRQPVNTLTSSELEFWQKIKDAPKEDQTSLIKDNYTLFYSASLKIKFREVQSCILQGERIVKLFLNSE